MWSISMVAGFVLLCVVFVSLSPALCLFSLEEKDIKSNIDT